MDFGLHPSKKLQKLFTEKPYQIQEPEKSKIIFLGRDANWDINIEKDPLFPEFKEYIRMVLDENNKDHLNRIKKLQQNGKVTFLFLMD